jgi:hypothetical protein
MQRKIIYKSLIITFLILTMGPHQALAGCSATEQCQGMGLDPNTICTPLNETACRSNSCCMWFPDLNPPTGWMSTDNSIESTNISTTGENNGPKLKIPELEITLPGLLFSDENKIQSITEGDKTFFYVPWIGEYINWLYNYSIGIIALLALLAIIIGGFYWIIAGGNASRVSEAKSWINAAISGLVLALTSYLLLFTINSNLVKLPPIKIGYTQKKNIDFINNDIYTQITRNSSASFKISPETLAAMQKFAHENNIDPCILYAIIGRESGGKLNAIGHDEEVSYTGSYKRFIKDKTTYKGHPVNTAHPINDDKDCTSGFKKGSASCDPKTLSLDWRYSHGIGLAQATPNPREGTLATKCDGLRNGSGSDYGYLFSDGTCISLRNLITYEGTFQFLAKSWKTFYCRGNRQLIQCFRAYAGGDAAINGSNAAANSTANSKMSTYNYCLQNKHSLFPSGAGGSF